MPQRAAFDFGPWMAKRRQQVTCESGAPLSQKKLAGLIHISVDEIRLIEHGRIPHPDILKALAPHLNVPYVTLLMMAGYLTAEQLNDSAGIHPLDGALTAEERDLALGIIRAYRQFRRHQKGTRNIFADLIEQ